MIQGQEAPTWFTLQLDLEGEFDRDVVDRLTRQLRRELLELEVESADFIRGGELPEGAKAADAVTFGALLVAVLPSFLPKLIEFLQSWLLRAEGRKVKVKSQVGDRSIELEYAPDMMSPQALKTLVETLTNALVDSQAGE